MSDAPGTAPRPAPQPGPPTAPPTAGASRAGRATGFLNPYVQLGVGAVLVTASELLLKRGASAVAGSAPSTGPAAWFGVAALASGWTWAGIVSYVLSFASWVHVLRFVPLSVAFPVINVVHVLVPVGAWLLLGEAVPARRWIGISLILAGILLILRPVARAEEGL